MFRTFIKSAFRNFKKDRFHLILNITGLALGLAAFLYIVTYVSYELSFDRFHSKSDRIYRSVAFLKMNNVETNFAKSELPLAQAVRLTCAATGARRKAVYERALAAVATENKKE